MSGGAVAPKDGKLVVLSSDGADHFSEIISGVFFFTRMQREGSRDAGSFKPSAQQHFCRL